MSYPGNPSLSAEVQRRILGTFNQSLDLAAGGRRQEASLGCEFILQLDPSFAAAGILRDRLAAGEGAVAVEDLRDGQVPPAPAPSELPSFATMKIKVPPLGPSVVPELQELLDRRDFGSVLSRLQATPALLQQAGVREIAVLAQERFEAQPYVQTYLEAAGRALQTGATHEVPALLEKVRSLDPSHPLIDDLARAAASSPGGIQDRELPDVSFDAAPEPVEDYELEIPEEDWNLEPAAALGLVPEEDTPGAGDFAPLIPPEPAASPTFSGSAAPVSPPTGPSFDFGSLDALPALDAPSMFGDQPAWTPPPLSPPPPVAPSLPSFSAPPPAVTPPAFEVPSFLASPGASFGMPDLGLPAATAGAAGDDRIAALLEEGDTAQARGDLQSAIDAWSRIFLIDVDHAAAAQRIEGARRQKAEQERQVEEIFHEGVAEFERGRPDDARARFNRVLALQPGHLAAREALERLEAGTGSISLGLGAPASELDPLSGFGGTSVLADLKEEILVPPPPGGGAAASAAEGRKGASLENFRMVAVKKETSKRTFFLIGGVVFALVCTAGWLLVANRDKLFPNSTEEVPAPKADAVDPIQHAEKLFKEGKAENALAYLKRVRPDHPKFSTAQSMIASWEKSAEEEAAAAAGAALDSQRERVIAAAEAAEREQELLLASLLYERAAKVGPLAPEEQAAADRITLVLKPLRDDILLFRDREYDLLLPRLWRKREADPGNRDVLRMLVDSYYNLGVKALQQNDPKKALVQFDQVLELTAKDSDSQRLRRFAQVYGGREPDLLYRTFVKYLPQR